MRIDDWVIGGVVWLTYTGACLGWGWALCRVFRWSGVSVLRTAENGWNGVATAWATGLVVVNLLLTALGLAGQLRLWPLIGAVFLPGLLAFGTAWATADRCGPNLTNDRRSLPDRAVFWGAAVLAGGFGLFAVLGPPTGDAEAFYFTYAKEMAATGRLAPMRGVYEGFSNIGLPLELHYTALLAVGGQAAAKLFAWSVAPVCIAFVCGIVRLCGGGTTARTYAVALSWSSTTFAVYTIDGKVDLAAAALGVGAIYWALDGWIQRRAFAAPLAGFLAGAATCAKFSYLPVLGVAMAVIVTTRVVRTSEPADRVRNWCHAAVTASIWAALAWAPQLLKNAVLFHAPLAPFLGASDEGHWLQQVWFSPEVIRHILLSYPLALVFGRYPGQGGGLSLLFIALAPLVWWGRMAWREHPILRTVTWAAVAALAAWMILCPSILAPRYILATLLLFVPLLAVGVEGLWRSPGWFWLRAGTLGVTLAALVLQTWYLRGLPGAVAAFVTGRTAPCVLAGPACGPLQTVNAAAGPGERVFLGTYYGYHLRVDLLLSTQTAEEDKRVKASDPAGTLALLQDGGFRFVVVDRAITKAFDGFAEIAARAPDTLHWIGGGDGIDVYRVGDGAALRDVPPLAPKE